MGQYHAIFNLDKNEMISASAFNEGVKLLEGSTVYVGLALLLANSNGRGGGDLYVRPANGKYEVDSKGRIKLNATERSLQERVDGVSGRWAGDRIVIQGDYAQRGDRAYIGKKRLETFTDISEAVADALRADEYFAEKIDREGF